MTDWVENTKTCPILAASAGAKSASTGSNWAAHCKREKCGFWVLEADACGVAAIGKILMAQTLVKSDTSKPLV